MLKMSQQCWRKVTWYGLELARSRVGEAKMDFALINTNDQSETVSRILSLSFTEKCSQRISFTSTLIYFFKFVKTFN